MEGGKEEFPVKEGTLPILPSRPGGCCSCGLCASTCPKGAIAMRVGADGFYRPFVDANLCIGCKACENMCSRSPRSRDGGRLPRHECFAAYCADEETRRASSSGGIIALLARYVVRKGGVVFAVGLQERNRACYVAVEREEDLPKLRGSIYLSVDAKGCFNKVAEALKTGRTVLFVGVPCQVHALRVRFGYRNTNLLVADIACFGVPSLLAFDSWLDMLERTRGKQVKRVFFRDKTEGWRAYRMKVEYMDSTLEVVRHNGFHEMFTNRLCLNEACYSCEKTLDSRLSDWSVGDFWGMRFSPEEEELGVSSFVCHTEAGKHVLQQLAGEIVLKPVSDEMVVRGNGGMSMRRQEMPWQRAHVLEDLKEMPFEEVYMRYLVNGKPRLSVAAFGSRVMLPPLLCKCVFKLNKIWNRFAGG